MSAKKKILTVVTNAKTLHLTDGTEHPSGYWAEELAVPYSAFRRAGYDVDISTVDGVVPTVDASSLDPESIRWVVPADATPDFTAAVRDYRNVLDDIAQLQKPLNVGGLSKNALAAYDGIYIAGGHGCMTDMPSSHQMARMLLRALELSKPLASVCHGPTALMAPRDAEGRNPFAGYRFTCFSQREETVTPVWKRLPMVIQYELQAQGLHHSQAEGVWGSHVVRDRMLLTGQNPYSSKALAESFLKMLAGN